MFNTLEILGEFADATARVPGGEVWNTICELALARKRRASRISYQKWIAKWKNVDHKRKYMKEYGKRDVRKAFMKAYSQRPERKAAQAAHMRRHRAKLKAALPPLQRSL